MREILFRGKTEISERWVVGDLVQWRGDDMCICEEYNSTEKKQYAVIPETIGQYTGLTDKNGKKIFEGDIIKHYNHNPIREYSEDVGKVFYYSKSCRFLRTSELFPNVCLEIEGCCGYEVIGNIYDNPELLKGGEE